MAAPDVERAQFRRKVDDEILLLFSLVTEALSRATAALLDQEYERANSVVVDDSSIDARCEALSALVKEALFTAADEGELEDLVTILQIVPELERSGDLAEHVAQRAIHGLGGIISPQVRGTIQSMNDVAVEMWQGARSAYDHQSRDVAFGLSEADNELDALASRLVADCITQGTEAEIAVQLALLARFYERLGDHAVNLARRVDIMASPRRLVPVKKFEPNRVRTSRSDRGSQRVKMLSRFKRPQTVPTDDVFFELFLASATNARDCAEELSKLIISFSDLDEHYARIKDFEHRGDQITAELLRHLDACAVTPYGREDIHALTEELDDVVDDMFSAASLIQLVQVEKPLTEQEELAEILIAMTDEMVGLMGCLRDPSKARHHLERIDHFERQGDVIFRRSMARLFDGSFNALDVIRWKDIVQAIENALNAIEDVSDVVESILVKNG